MDITNATFDDMPKELPGDDNLTKDWSSIDKTSGWSKKVVPNTAIYGKFLNEPDNDFPILKGFLANTMNNMCDATSQLNESLLFSIGREGQSSQSGYYKLRHQHRKRSVDEDRLNARIKPIEFSIEPSEKYPYNSEFMQLSTIDKPDRAHQALIQYINSTVLHVDNAADLYGRYYQTIKGMHAKSMRHLFTAALLDFQSQYIRTNTPGAAVDIGNAGAVTPRIICNRTTGDLLADNLNGIVNGRIQAIYVPGTGSQVTMAMRLISRWYSAYPMRLTGKATDMRVPGAAQAQNYNLIATADQIQIPAQYDRILFLLEDIAVVDIADNQIVENPTPDQILQIIRLLLNTYGDIAYDDFSYAMTRVCGQCFGVMNDVANNNWTQQTNLNNYLNGNLEFDNFSMQQDYTHISLILPFINPVAGYKKPTSVHSTEQYNAVTLYRHMTFYGMAICNATFQTLFTVGIDHQTLLGSLVNANYNALTQPQQQLIHKVYDEAEQSGASIFALGQVNTIDLVYDLRAHPEAIAIPHRQKRADSRATVCLAINTITVHQNECPNLTLMFDTVHIMRNILLSQLENTPETILKISILNGIPIMHGQINNRQIRFDSVFRNVGVNQHVSDGGNSYHMKLFNDIQYAQPIHQELMQYFAFANAPQAGIRKPALNIFGVNWHNIRYQFSAMEYQSDIGVRRNNGFIVYNDGDPTADPTANQVRQFHQHLEKIKQGFRGLVSWVQPVGVNLGITMVPEMGQQTKTIQTFNRFKKNNTNPQHQGGQQGQYGTQVHQNINVSVNEQIIDKSTQQSTNYEQSQQFRQNQQAIIQHKIQQQRRIDLDIMRVQAIKQWQKLQDADQTKIIGTKLSILPKSFKCTMGHPFIQTFVDTLIMQFEKYKDTNDRFWQGYKMHFMYKWTHYLDEMVDQRVKAYVLKKAKGHKQLGQIGLTIIQLLQIKYNIQVNSDSLPSYNQLVGDNQAQILTLLSSWSGTKAKRFSNVYMNDYLLGLCKNLNRAGMFTQVYEFVNQEIVNQAMVQQKLNPREFKYNQIPQNHNDKWNCLVSDSDFKDVYQSSLSDNDRGNLIQDIINERLQQINMSYGDMVYIQELYKNGKINRKQLAQARHRFAPSAIQSDDYVQLPQVVKQLWTKNVIDLSVTMNKCQLDIHVYNWVIKYLSGGASGDANMYDKIKDCHDKLKKEHLVRTKINLIDVLKSAKYYLNSIRSERQGHNIYRQNNSTKATAVRHIAELCAMKNTWSQYAVSSHIIATCGNKFYIKMLSFIRQINLIKYDRDDVIKISKQIHTIIRRTGCWVNGQQLTSEERVGMQYLQDLMGRGEYSVDWQQEMKNRCLPNKVKIYGNVKTNSINPVEYIDTRNKQLYEFLNLMGKSWFEIPPYPVYMKTRYEWTKSGSAAGAKIKVEDEIVRLNKRGAMQNVKSNLLGNALYYLPITIGTHCEKYENAKNRALYPTDLINYTVGSYILNNLENQLNKIEGVGMPGDPLRKMQKIFDISNKCEQRMNTWCYDWKDFNQTHTPYDQQAIWLTLAELNNDNPHRDSKFDINLSCVWMAQSKINQWLSTKNMNINIDDGTKVVQFPETKQQGVVASSCGFDQLHTLNKVRIHQGMFSGQRDTDFVNTIMNKVQSNMVQNIAQEWFGHKQPVLYSMHKGDDIAAFVDDWLSGVVMNTGMSWIGLEGNDDKLLSGEGEVEFLRNLYLPDNKVMGYLNRSIPNIVSKDLQGASNEEISNENIIDALQKQITKCVCRGLNKRYSDILLDIGLRYWKKVVVQKKKYDDVDIKRMNSSVINGGKGLFIKKPPKIDKFAMYSKVTSNLTEQLKRDVQQGSGLKGYATREYLQWAISQVDDKQVIQKLMGKYDMLSGQLNYQDTVANTTQSAKNRSKLITNVLDNKYKLKIQEKPQITERQISNLRTHCGRQAGRWVSNLVTAFQSDRDTIPMSILEACQSAKGAFKIKDVIVLKEMYQAYKVRYGQHYLQQFLKDQCKDQYVRQQVIECNRKYGIKLTEQALFENISFDDVLQGRIHNDFHPIIRKIAGNIVDEYKGKLDLTTYQLTMRIAENVLANAILASNLSKIKLRY